MTPSTSAAAGALETEALSFPGDAAFNHPNFASSPGEHGFTRWPCADTFHSPPGWRHANDAPLDLVISVATWTGSLSRVDALRAYFFNHESKLVMSPRSTDGDLSRCFTRPPCKCRAGWMYHSLIALRSKLRRLRVSVLPMRPQGVIKVVMWVSSLAWAVARPPCTLPSCWIFQGRYHLVVVLSLKYLGPQGSRTLTPSTLVIAAPLFDSPGRNTES